MGGGGQKSHLNKKCRKFHEMDKSTKKIFHSLANLDLEIFLSKFEMVVGGGGQKSHLNKKCRKFHEMDKSTKKIFHSLANLDLEIFLSKFEMVVGGGGGSKITPEQKMQEIS